MLEGAIICMRQGELFLGDVLLRDDVAGCTIVNGCTIGGVLFEEVLFVGELLLYTTWC